jgi:hypothetical protein
VERSRTGSEHGTSVTCIQLNVGSLDPWVDAPLRGGECSETVTFGINGRTRVYEDRLGWQIQTAAQRLRFYRWQV